MNGVTSIVSYGISRSMLAYVRGYCAGVAIVLAIVE